MSLSRTKYDGITKQREDSQNNNFFRYVIDEKLNGRVVKCEKDARYKDDYFCRGARNTKQYGVPSDKLRLEGTIKGQTTTGFTQFNNINPLTGKTDLSFAEKLKQIKTNTKDDCKKHENAHGRNRGVMQEHCANQRQKNRRHAHYFDKDIIFTKNGYMYNSMVDDNIRRGQNSSVIFDEEEQFKHSQVDVALVKNKHSILYKSGLSGRRQLVNNKDGNIKPDLAHRN